jgi:beta-glucosidase
MTFPQDFVWGAAAASFQIEGAANDDGKGPSVWDMFCTKPGAVFGGHTGNVACDHYRRYAGDVALMKEIGLKAYRLSISWPRVVPEGTGAVNEKGLAFYDRLIDALLAAGIEPYVTLFHWDFPLALYRRGGWLSPDSPAWFADYADLLARRYSDRVKCWMTHNEPQCFTLLGHESGIHAPGDKLARSEILVAIHHALLAHGKGTQALRAAARQPLKIGIAPVGGTSMPATESDADRRAASEHMWNCHANTWANSWWLDPVFLGKYPDDGLRTFAPHVPKIGPNDFATIQQPLDFLGLNIYYATVVRARSDGKPEVVPPAPGSPMNALAWSITPDALYYGPKGFYERYGKPIFITENGVTVRDAVATDGKVHDPQRIDFTRRYLRSLHRAISEGVKVNGYFHWSVMDNFEWAEGYKERFGLIHVDYATQERTLKDSAYWYRDVIASNGQAAIS